MVIRNIIFDLGNVLLDFDPDSYLEELGYQDEIKEELKTNIFETEEWLMLDRGTITQENAVKKWQRRNSNIKEEIAAVMADWEEILTLKDDSLGVLKSLAAKDFNLYILSNFHKKAFAYVSQKYDFLKYFDGRVISAEVEMIKPEAEIYEYLLKEFNIKAEETLFIDDSKKNIKAALKKGIRVIHFKDADSLKKELNLYLRE